MNKFDEMFITYNKMKEHHVCIYGCGNNGKQVIDILDNRGVIIEVSDRCGEYGTDKYKIIPIEQLEQLDKEVVCIVTPEKEVTEEYNRLQKHFNNVINIEQFRGLHLEHYIPSQNNDWGWECYMPLNSYDSPYITSDSMEYRFYNNTEVMRPFGIEFREKEQVELLRELGVFYDDFYRDMNEKSVHMRYKKQNSWFGECDAALLYSMLRIYKPKRYIEIGSGYSTAIALDVRERYFNNKMKMVCIEPYPERLIKNKKQEDEIKIYPKCVQEISADIFENLEEGDVLFIDSSHVAKLGGDVPFEYFEILPRLRKGVIIHIHDMFYPFTYPKSWIKQGRCYNEAFIVRALLMNNKNYKILFFNDMMVQLHNKEYKQICNCLGGGSLWLQKM